MNYTNLAMILLLTGFAGLLFTWVIDIFFMGSYESDKESELAKFYKFFNILMIVGFVLVIDWVDLMGGSNRDYSRGYFD
jgi:zinc transporter ZupT